MTEKGPVVAACIPAFNEEDSIVSVIFMAGMTVEALCPSMNTGRARVSGFGVSWG